MKYREVLELEHLDVKPLNGQVLLEYFDLNETAKYGSLELYVPRKKYDYGNSKDHTATSNVVEHSEKEGRVLSACDRINNKKKENYDFDPKIDVSPGDWVWFNALSFKSKAQHFEYEGRKLALIDYQSLYMRERNGSYRMLNGYVLAERMKRQGSPIISAPFEEYHPNIFKVFKRGEPVEYDGDVYSDWEDIKEGDCVITRSFEYPLFETEGHKRFSDKTLHIFQTREIFARVVQF